MDGDFLIVGNWKAHMTILEMYEWIKTFSNNENAVDAMHNLTVSIAPSSITLTRVSDELSSSGLQIVALCAQDVSQFPVGSFTGENPAAQVILLAHYCLIGHSERRKKLGETTEMVAEKLNQAIGNKLVPIICAQNFEEIPDNISNFSDKKIYVMYEPNEAISTNGQYHAESPEQVGQILNEWKTKLSPNIRFLYGGSVNPENVGSILSSNKEALSGFVVGHASLDPEQFFSIISQCHSLL